MNSTAKSARISALISFALLLLIVIKADAFLELEEWGSVLLLSSAGAALLVLPAAAFKLERLPAARCFAMLLLLLVAPFVMMLAVERLNGNFITGFLTDEDILENYVVYLLLYILAFGLSGSVRISVMTVSPVLLLFGIANMYVKEFKGSPLVPMDFSSIRTAGNVASAYTYEIGYEIVFALCLTVCLLACASRLSMPKLERAGRWFKRGLCLICLLVAGGFAYTFYFTDTIADYGLKPDFFNQTRGYKNHGAVLEFTLNTKYLWLQTPYGYDADAVNEIVQETLEGQDEAPSILKTALLRQGVSEEKAAAAVDVPTAVENGQKPNIIVIMNESFSELNVVGDFTTNIPYMDVLDELRDETIQGNVYVSTIGTGTSNTEYEFLTGNAMAFLPAGSNAYQLYEKTTQPGLTSTLEDQGYSSLALHPYFETSWNRIAVYDYMGFDDFITVEDLFGEDLVDQYISSGYSFKLYNRLLKRKFPGQSILLRRYVSDAYDFKTVERLYEERNPDQPFYVFNITMQNHSSYDQKLGNFDEQVWLTSTKREYAKTNQYLSLIYQTNQDFADLLEYFSNVEEPTIILMFGDHQPFIEDSFYSEVMGSSVSELSDEEQQKRYITRFVLWANYEIPTGWVDEISVNYLSVLLQQVAGTELTDYSRYLANLYTKLPVITSMGCLDAEGNYFQADGKSSLGDLIAGYRYVAYNNLADTQHREDALFYLPVSGGESQ